MEEIYKDLCGMYEAEEIAKQSKDPNTKVGACIVGNDNTILSKGYNDIPKGWKGNFPWGKDESLGKENTKYPFVIHAETNALNNFDGDKTMLEDATLYVTLFPCTNCSKQIIQSGIKRIVYKSDKYKDTEDNKLSKLLLSTCGVEFISYNELTDIKNKVYHY